jgi:hypothetical protein
MCLYLNCVYSDRNRNPSGTDLPLNAIQERTNIFTTVCTTCRYAYSYQDHLHFFIALKKGKKEDVQKYRDAMPALTNVVLNRNTLVKVTETYLLSRREKKFEKEVGKPSALDAIPLTGVGGSRNQVAPAAPPVCVEESSGSTNKKSKSKSSRKHHDDDVISFDGEDEDYGSEEQNAGPELPAEEGGWFGGSKVKYTLGLNGEVLEHDMCCMCGCRERVWD